MAFFAASVDSDAGLAGFDLSRQRSAKYDAAETRRRWEHYRRSPHRLGPGTLVYEARQVDPTFQLPSTRHSRAEAKQTPANDGGRCWLGRAGWMAPPTDHQRQGRARDVVANAAIILRSDLRFIDRCASTSCIRHPLRATAVAQGLHLAALVGRRRHRACAWCQLRG